MNVQRAFVASVFAFSLACSGGSSNPDGGGNPEGGSTTDGGDGGASACNAPGMATILQSPFTGFSPSLAEQDVYWVDPDQGPTWSGQIKTGVIRHMKTDGTGDSVVYTPTSRPIYSAQVAGADIIFFQLDPDMGSGPPVHMYKVSRSGGAATQVGTYDWTAVNLVTTIDTPSSPYKIGIFARSGDNLFMNEGKVISRVALASGARTVIADAGSALLIINPALHGNTIHYLAQESSKPAPYKVAADATSPSQMRVGTQTCDMGFLGWNGAAKDDGAWICGALWGLDAIDATGATRTRFYDTKPVDSIYFPSPIDGTTFYAFGNSPGSKDPIRPLLKMDTRTPNVATPVLCDIQVVWNVRMSATDLVWEEQRGSVRSLRRLAR